MATAEGIDQRRQALEVANLVRHNGAAVRREVQSGSLTIEDAMWDLRAQAIPIGRLLMDQPRWGPQKTGDLLRGLGIWPGRRVRELTDRQRRLIEDATR